MNTCLGRRIKIKKKLNSWQIAKLAGVSRSTVSRVINNYPNVPKETREKVMNVIKQYNYYPNISAQVLAGKKTNTIGLFWISNKTITEDYLSNFFMASVIENAARYGYHVLTVVVPDLKSTKEANRVKEVFYQGRIDGAIFIGIANHEPVIEELISAGFVIGLLDQFIPGKNEPNRVLVNFDDETAEKAVDYLVSLNHRKIGIIHGDLKRYNGKQKYEGYLRGFNKHGLKINEKWVEYTDFTSNAGYLAMKKILERSDELPTAICCANDNIAFGAMKAIFEANLKIPDDISIIGVDDHMLSSLIKPSLTTFRVDFTSMIKTLTENVIKVIQKENNDEFIHIQFGSQLIERESCKKI